MNFIKKYLIVLSILCYLSTSFVFGQAPFCKNKTTMHSFFARAPGFSNQYNYQGENVGARIIFNPDSSFEYYCQEYERLWISFGRYSVLNNFIYFTWDSCKTQIAVADSNVWRKHFHSKPKYLKIENVAFVFNDKTHYSFQRPKSYDVIEVFFKSSDVFSHGLVIDSLRDFPFPYGINSKKNKFILNRKFGKNIEFPLDSVWGWRRADEQECYSTVRLWGNGFFDQVIVQYDEMVIYLFSTGKYTHSVFSINLDSPIYMLTTDGLKECFKDNKIFLELLAGEKEMKNTIWFDNARSKDKNGRYRVLDLYKKYLQILGQN
jgi:hypothetical protein